MELNLQAQPRSTEKPNQLRKQGKLPAIIYGPQFPSRKVEVSYQEFVKVFRRAGKTQTVYLEVEGSKTPVLVHDIQLDPVEERFLHVDFYRFQEGKKVEATIPLEFQGVSSALKDKGGVLLTNLREIQARALPEELVSSIPVDMSSLDDIGDEIRLKDLQIPKSIEIINDPEVIVVSIVAPARAEEVAPVPSVEQKEAGGEAQQEGGEAKRES